MPLSNTTNDLLAGQPYWDDYDQTKGFHRVLIRPKFPVQTRELNQLQSMLQNQVEQLAVGSYKEGKAVNGGEQAYANNVLALQVVKNPSIDIANFYSPNNTTGGATVRGGLSGAEGRIVQVARQANEDYSALIIAPMNANTFQGDEQITITVGTNQYTMTTAPSAVVTRNAAVFSIREGTFFLLGHLVYVPQQSVVVSSSNNTPYARIGFEMSEVFITPSDDETLLDPALNSTNYAAPGAHRLKISATLATRIIDPNNATLATQNGSENFIEIARVGEPLPQYVEPTPIQPPPPPPPPPPVVVELPRITEDDLARRTYDESGHYVVRPFRIAAKNHQPLAGVPNGIGRISGNTTSTLVVNTTATSFTTQMDPGDILVVGDQQREIVSVSNDTHLTVNSAFSVEFANSNFSFIDDDLMTLELEAGKAYIRGYEFETLGTTKLAVPRARTTQNIDNGVVSTYFGPYVNVKRGGTNGNGIFDVMSTQRVDMHCVDYSNIKNATSVVYNASRIGTARVRSLIYSTGTGNSDTIHKLYLAGMEFETKTYQVNTSATSADTNLTSLIVVSASANQITLTQNVNSGSGGNLWIFPQTANAFLGSTIKLYSKYGETLYYDVVASTFANASTAQAASVVLTFSSGGLLDRVNTAANVVASFNEKSVRGFSTSNTKAVGATVANESRLGLVSQGNTVFTGTEYVPMLFKLREDFISPTSIKDETFSATYKWSVSRDTPSPNVTHDYYTINAPNGVEFPAVVNTLGHTIFTAANSTKALDMSAWLTDRVDSNTVTFTVPVSVSGSATLTIHGAVEVTSNVATTTVRRTKTFRSGNVTVTAAPVSGNLVSDVTKGQIAINDTTLLIANANFNVVGLGVVDATALKKVYAVTKGSALGTGDTALTDTAVYTDVTERYTLDTGQRSWCYDHSALVLKPGYMHYSANQMLVVVDLFQHSSSDGYFTANSYNVDYEDIPLFTNPDTGETVPLRDYIDFRPSRTQNLITANTTYVPYVGANQTFDAQNFIPHPDEYVQLDYAHYLSRVDKIVLTAEAGSATVASKKIMKVIQGEPAVQPVPPADPEGGMTLYMVVYPPYTANAELVQIEAIDHRRYTMRDIGRLEKRIERLEYYVQLSQLEDRTLANPELDEDNIERFKNGMIIDPFASHAVANVFDDDYQASIDENNRELRPAFVSQGMNIGEFLFDDSINAQRVLPETGSTENLAGEASSESAAAGFSGPYSLAPSTRPLRAPSRLIFPTYTRTVFIKQVLASKLVNVNPFGVAVWRGRITLNPASDVWMDTERRPPVSINLFNENDNWQEKSFGTVWNDWQTTWTGVPVTERTHTDTLGGIIVPSNRDPRRVEWASIKVDSLATRVESTEQRTGTTIKAKTSKSTTDLGDKLLDIVVAPYMRSRGITFTATGLKPGSVLTPLFDNVDVSNYVERASEIRLATANAAGTFRVGDEVVSNASSTGTAIIAAITGNTLRVVNPRGRFMGSVAENIHVTVSARTGFTPVQVQEYVSYAGRVEAATTTTVTLDTGASAVNDAYTGQRIRITTGAGSGQVRTITDYDGGTKLATVDPPLNDPSTLLRYAIGQPVADPSGATQDVMVGEMGYNAPSVSSRMPGTAYGLFYLPSGTFGSGKRLFRLTDDPAAAEAGTFAEATYESSGTTRVTQGQTVSTLSVDFETVPTSQHRNVTTVTSAGVDLTLQQSGIYWDPIAQTFLVDGSRYPSGMYLTDVDLFFGKRDTQRTPIYVQIRPTVNGFPSADVVLGTAERYTVNLVPPNTQPNAINPAHYTRFTFESPIYLKGGEEYAIVVLTNSFDYEVMVSEIGKNQIGTDIRISEQPYAGSFFKSQNSRTWTPQQEEDLMFVLHRAVFSTKPVTASFRLTETPTNAPFGGGTMRTTDASGVYYYDVYNLDTNHIEFGEAETPTKVYLTVTNADTTTSTFETPVGENVVLDSRARINSGDVDSARLIIEYQTKTDAVAPMYDSSRFNFIAVRNVIDNGQLYANGITIVNPGQLAAGAGGMSTYANTNSVTVSITGTMANGATSGSGGVGTLYINSLGQVETVYITTNGSGYLENVSVNNAPVGVSWTTNPVFVYRGETSNKQNIAGEQKARYITRRVTLADGFDAGDIKVYLSANRPPQTNIDVYYKVLSAGDKENFDDKKWVRMLVKDTQQNVFASSQQEFREYEYRTIGNTAAYVSNSVDYTRFNTFSIKVVLRSEDTTIVPRLRNIRGIALDV